MRRFAALCAMAGFACGADVVVQTQTTPCKTGDASCSMLSPMVTYAANEKYIVSWNSEALTGMTQYPNDKFAYFQAYSGSFSALGSSTLQVGENVVTTASTFGIGAFIQKATGTNKQQIPIFVTFDSDAKLVTKLTDAYEMDVAAVTSSLSLSVTLTDASNYAFITNTSDSAYLGVVSGISNIRVAPSAMEGAATTIVDTAVVSRVDAVAGAITACYMAPAIRCSTYPELGTTPDSPSNFLLTNRVGYPTGLDMIAVNVDWYFVVYPGLRDGSADTASIFGLVYGFDVRTDNTPKVAEFQISSSTSTNAHRSRVTKLGNGKFIVSWQAEGLDSGSTSGVYARVYTITVAGDAVTATPDGDEFLLSEATAGNQRKPSVAKATSAGDDFVAVWEESDGGDTVIKGQYFASAPGSSTPPTDPPATNPPATNPPATNPPATNPPATDPPATPVPETAVPPTPSPPGTTIAPETDVPPTATPTDAPPTDVPATPAPPTLQPTWPPGVPKTDAPATDAPATESPSDDSDNTVIIVVVVCSVAAVLLIGAAVYFFKFRGQTAERPGGDDEV